MVVYVNGFGTKEKLIKFRPRTCLTCCNKQAPQKSCIAGLDVLPLQGIVVLCCCWCGLQFEVPGKWGFAAVINTMHPQRIFVSLLKLDFSWMSINCFHGFFKSSDRESSLIIKEQSKDLQQVSSDESISNYFIRSTTPASVSLMWRITMSKQCCPCVPSEIIATTLIVYGKVFRFFKLDCMKTQELWANCQEV